MAGDVELVFRVHAVRRMFEQRISLEDVRQVVQRGRPIEDYPDATPYPSRLMLGWCGSRPLHVVLADNPSAGEAISFQRKRGSWARTARLLTWGRGSP